MLHAAVTATSSSGLTRVAVSGARHVAAQLRVATWGCFTLPYAVLLFLCATNLAYRQFFSQPFGLVLVLTGAFMSLVGLVAKPEIFTKAFKSLRSRKGDDAASQRSDVLAGIEVPLWISWVGVPVFSVMTHNIGNPAAYFKLTASRVIELGSRVEL